MDFQPNILMDELSKGLGKEGDLVLMIGCTKCPAQFYLNNESIVMAIATETTFVEYVRWIQNSKCPSCNKEKKNES
jgi:hypothetical protein